MPEKVLTISVAAYNLGNLIDTCLSSCAVDDILDELEIIVVDDGSTDDTASYAAEYASRYPESFTLVTKENGGYGSTVNLSMGLATGKYYRILDGDDWLSEEGLIALVGFLRAADVDWVVQDRLDVDSQFNVTLVPAGDARLRGRSFALASQGPRSVNPGMWFSTFRADLFKQNPFRLPEHTLYLDTVFMANNVARSSSCTYLDTPLYCYRSNASDSQSTSRASKISHFDDYVSAYRLVLEIACSCSLDEHPQLKERVKSSYLHLYNVAPMLPSVRSTCKLLQQLDCELHDASPALHQYVGEGSRAKTLNMLRKSGFRLYWPRVLAKRLGI